MLKRVVHSLGLVDQTHEKNPTRKNNVRGGNKASPESDLRSKDIYVRIVHHGGQQEVYHSAFPASKLMAKYPGMCVARAEVFNAPQNSVLRPEERLLLGHKYIIISSKDVDKLIRKHPRNGKTKEQNGVVTQKTLEENITKSSPSVHRPKENCKLSVPNGEMMDTKITLSHSEGEILEKVYDEMNVSQGGDVEEVYCSAKDFYVSKDKPARYSRRKGIKAKKPFVPPLPKGRLYRGLEWKPSLATVQELSPIP